MNFMKKNKLINIWFSNVLSLRDNTVQTILKANREKTRIPIKKLRNNVFLIDKYTQKIISIKGAGLAGH
jgi:hypothetical protein